MPIRILFVDDDDFLLAALKRLAWDYEDEWECKFSDSGASALKLLASQSFDVVVSDMRMPSMDGAQLLTQVRDKYPNVVRIILSGQSECESIFRAIGPAHVYLSKPCNEQELKSAIDRGCVLRSRIADRVVHRVVSHVSTLPTLPRLTQQIIRLLQSPDASVDAIAQLMSQDVAMTAKLIQLVNSSFFGMQQQVSSVKQAATYLGLDKLKLLVFSAGVFSHFDGDKLGAFSLEKLMHHSVAVATLARSIAVSESDSTELADHAMLAGMLHDIGMLVLAQYHPEQFQESLTQFNTTSLSICEAENLVMGFNHAEIGAHLIDMWGLPHPVVEAVAYHHQPDAPILSEFTPLTALYGAILIEGGHDPFHPATKRYDGNTDILPISVPKERFERWKALKITPVESVAT